MQLLREELGLRPDHVVADVGSGPGLLSEPLLATGNSSSPVEANRAMARAAAGWLGGNHRFHDVDGRASHGLQAGTSTSSAGQASMVGRRRRPGGFRRILKPDGWVVLVWNVRRLEGRPSSAITRRSWASGGRDYKEVSSGTTRRGPARPLGPCGYRTQGFENRQTFDLEGSAGGSCRVVHARRGTRARAHAGGAPALFDGPVDGQVALEYDTHVYYGRL